MKDVRYDELVRLSFQRQLTPEEASRLENCFADDPRARAQWEEERALSRAVASLPDAPVSSNFTARVLHAIDLDEAAAERRRRARFSLRTILPRFTVAAAAALLALFGVHEWRALNRAKLAQDVWLVTQDVKRVPDAEVLQDFEVINGLRAAPAVSDDELLIALQ